MIGGALVLFVITLAGVFIACKVFEYDIPILRKVGAAGAFAVLNVVSIPIPFVDLILPPIALYVILMDNSHQRSQVNRVFGLTFLFAIVAILIIYLPQRI